MALYEALKHHGFSHVRDQTYCISQVPQQFPPQQSSIVWEGVLCRRKAVSSGLQPSKISSAGASERRHRSITRLVSAGHLASMQERLLYFLLTMKAFQGPTMQFFLEQRLKTRQAESSVLLCADIQTFSAKDSNKLHDMNSSLKLPGFSN